MKVAPVRRCVRLVCAVFSALVLAGCASTVEQTVGTSVPAPEGRSIFWVGSVEEVLRGRAPGLMNQRYSARDFRVGFEAGSLSDAGAVGEMFAAGGVAYVKSTAPGPDHLRLVHGTHFVSPAGVFVAHNARPAEHLTLDPSEPPVTLDALYARLTRSAGPAWCVVGVVRFARYHTIAIARAPVDGLPILANRAAYYPHAPADRADVPAAIMACAADFAAVSDPTLARDLRRVLYDNPADSAGTLSRHAHALELKRFVPVIDSIRPADVRDVAHLLSDSSISAGSLTVYRVTAMSPLPARSPVPAR